MLKKNNFKIFLILLILFIFFALFFSFQYKVTVLRAVESRDENILWEKNIANENSFIIKYLHSVARTEVKEIFEIRDGEFFLTGTEYQSYGAGLPVNTEGQYILKDDKFIIKDIDYKIDMLLLRISDSSQHELIYQENRYPLYELTGSNALIEFRTEKLSYFKFLTQEVKKWLNLKKQN